MSNKQVSQKVEEVKFKSNKQLLFYSIAKSLVIGLILFESLGGYFETNNFNDDTYPRAYLHGAYTNVNPKSDIKRVFFHRKQYFIIQYMDDRFESYELIFSEDMKNLILTDEIKRQYILAFEYDESNQELSIAGELAYGYVYIITHKEKLEDLPFFDNKIKWTFD